MKPDKKAKELVEKFRTHQRIDPRYETKKDSIKRSKQCALICVDEMYNLIGNENWNDVAKQDYCINIKQELEKL